MEWDIHGVEPPEPTRLGDVVWLEPYPDALFEGAIDLPLGPEARYEQTEAISLAFVTALRVLPTRQLAVLILRDVLGYDANEVAVGDADAQRRRRDAPEGADDSRAPRPQHAVGGRSAGPRLSYCRLSVLRLLLGQELCHHREP